MVKNIPLTTEGFGDSSSSKSISQIRLENQLVSALHRLNWLPEDSLFSPMDVCCDGLLHSIPLDDNTLYYQAFKTNGTIGNLVQRKIYEFEKGVERLSVHLCHAIPQYFINHPQEYGLTPKSPFEEKQYRLFMKDLYQKCEEVF